MKYVTSDEIIAKALLNIYGVTTPAASVYGAAPHKLFDILWKVQRRHTFHWQNQRAEFSITSGDDEYTILGDIFLATEPGRLGAIYEFKVQTSTGQLIKLKRLDDMEWDMLTITANTGNPYYYREKFMYDLPTDATLKVYPTPDANLTGILYYKRIYLPASWTTPAGENNTYTSYALDELAAYLVAQLTAELAVLAGYNAVAQNYSLLADEELKTVISRSNEYDLQKTGGIGQYA